MIDIGKLTNEQTFNLAVEALSALSADDQTRAIKASVAKDDIEELISQLEESK
jgi:hypothetical protein